MERCIFCGSTRKTIPARRFFGIPREPGLKRIQWLYVLGDRDIGPKDRVCAIHFRQGKPSNDPSHEDYVPNLLLNSNNSESTIELLESVAEQEIKLKTFKPSILYKRKREKNTFLSSPTSSTLIPLPTSLTEGFKIVEGQEVVIKRYIVEQKNSLFKI